MDDARDPQTGAVDRRAGIRLLISFLPVFVVCTLRAADYDIEPKRPLTPAQELRVVQDERSIKVSGETFTYTFGKDNGLVTAVEVLGREVAGGTPIPDLSVAEHLDPEFSPYAARNERSARVTLVSASPSKVVIDAEGTYTARDGRPFPLRYTLRYDLSIDGVILVSLGNIATGPWLKTAMTSWSGWPTGAPANMFR